MRLSSFLTMLVSWRASQGARLPRPFFIFAHTPLEQPPDQHRNLGQRPALILAPAVRRQARIQRRPQPGQMTRR